MKRYYNKSHEWLAVEKDLARIGISDYAQDELGEITFVELPEEGKTLASGDVLVVIESVKIASDIHSPVSGTVVRVNAALRERPNLVNASPLDEGWLVEVQLDNTAELQTLLSAEAYEDFLGEMR